MKKALLINVSGIGDIVSSFVVAQGLKKQGYEVTYFVPKHFKGLLCESGYKEVIEVPKDEFDLVVDLTTNKESRNLTKKSHGKVKIGRYKNFSQRIRFCNIYSKMVPKFPKSDHIVQDFDPILDYLKIQKGEYPHYEVKLTPKNQICIHVGADKEIRQIPTELIVKVINYFKEKDIEVRIIGIEAEKVQEVLEQTDHYPKYDKTGLDQVVGWLKDSKMVIAPDSGILHTAATMGINSIGLYGPNTFKRSGPVNPNVVCIEKDYDCRPCNQNVDCPHSNKCMFDIQFEELKEQVNLFL